MYTLNPEVNQAKIMFIHTPPLTETLYVSVVRVDGAVHFNKSKN